MDELEFPNDGPETHTVGDRSATGEPAGAWSGARLCVPATVVAGRVEVAGLSYSSAQLALALAEGLRDRTAIARVDPDDLREIEARVDGRVFLLQATDQGLVAATALVVQLGLFDPPSVKRIGPASVRPRVPGAKVPKPPERPWLPTLAVRDL